MRMRQLKPKFNPPSVGSPYSDAESDRVAAKRRASPREGGGHFDFSVPDTKGDDEPYDNHNRGGGSMNSDDDDDDDDDDDMGLPPASMSRRGDAASGSEMEVDSTNFSDDGCSEIASSAETLALKTAHKDDEYLIPVGCPYWRKFERIGCKSSAKLAIGVSLRACVEGGKRSSLSRTVTNRMHQIVRKSAFWDVVDINEDGGHALLDKVGLRWANPSAPEAERKPLPKGYGVDAIMYGLDENGNIIDIILFQMKAYRDLSNPNLGTFFIAQHLVRKHLRMVEKVMAVVVAPFWSHLSDIAEIAWNPGGAWEEDHFMFLFRIDTPEPAEDSDERKVPVGDTAATKIVEAAIKTAEEKAAVERKKKQTEAIKLASALRKCEAEILNSNATNAFVYRKHILMMCVYGEDRVPHIDQYKAMVIIDAMMDAYSKDAAKQLYYCAALTEARLNNISLQQLGLECLPWHPDALLSTRDEHAKRRAEVKAWTSKMSKQFTALSAAEKRVYTDISTLEGSRVASFFAPTGCGKSACISYAVVSWFSASVVQKSTRSVTSQGRKIAIVFTEQLDSLRQLAADVEPAMCVRFGDGWYKHCVQLSSKSVVRSLNGPSEDANLNVFEKYQKSMKCLDEDKDKAEHENGMRIIYCSEKSAIYGFALLKRACELGYRALVVKDEAHHYDHFEELKFALPPLNVEEHYNRQRKRKAEAGPSSDVTNDSTGDAEPMATETAAPVESLVTSELGPASALRFLWRL